MRKIIDSTVPLSPEAPRRGPAEPRRNPAGRRAPGLLAPSLSPGKGGRPLAGPSGELGKRLSLIGCSAGFAIQPPWIDSQFVCNGMRTANNGARRTLSCTLGTQSGISAHLDAQVCMAWEINGVLELSYDKSGILESRSLTFDFSHFHFIEYLWFNRAGFRCNTHESVSSK